MTHLASPHASKPTLSAGAMEEPPHTPGLETHDLKAPTAAALEEGHDHPLAQLSSARKQFLLFIFAIASFTDFCNVSGVSIEVAQLAADLSLGDSQLVWSITSYSLCFASFMLLSGRLSDLFPAQFIFESGFVGLGVLSLATSFVHHSKYGFLILRGLGGIAGSMTVPSAQHLVVHMFPNSDERAKKLALLSMSGAVGNVLGLVLAGLTMLANEWWFFRVIAIVCLLFSALAIWLLPYAGSSYKPIPGLPRWKRLDLPGVVLLMGALICFILALTQGPIDGWSSASFIAPFVLSFPLAIGFFAWEAYISPESAVLPSSIWKTQNMVIASVATLFPFALWATSQIQYSTFWQEILRWKPIHVAAAILPQGIMALIVGGAVQGIPAILKKPRYTLAISVLLIVAAELLQIFSNGGRGKDYWKYAFPAFLLGSAGAVCGVMAATINLIVYVPPEMAGVAGAWTKVLAQAGGAITLAVQAGLQTKDLADWPKSSGRAYYFMLAWAVVCGGIYVASYRPYGTPEEEHRRARARIAASGKSLGVPEVEAELAEATNSAPLSV